MPKGVKKGEKKQTEEERQAKKKEYDKNYRQDPENNSKIRAYAREYNSRPENIIKAKERRPKYKGTDKKRLDKNRLAVLQYYSKRLSNSDIPCCNCCGETIQEFLAIDHISGKRQMDSEPELIKLGYKSKYNNTALINWILKNNYLKNLPKEYFQILCHNCNLAKGFYGTCPHETARKEEVFAMMEDESSFEV